MYQSGAYPPVLAHAPVAPTTPARGAAPAAVRSRTVSVVPTAGVHTVPQVAAPRSNLSQAPLLLEEPEPPPSMVRPSSRPTYRPSSSVPPQHALRTAPLGSQPSAALGQASEDAVLFSASQLGHVARPGGMSRGPQSRPGFAGGDSSGLVDIAALASLARQSAAPPVPRPALRPATMSTTPSVQLQPLPAVLDSLAPTTRRSGGSSKALPLAILASSAMVASATFAAILITRSTPAVPPAPAAAAAPVAVQPVAAPAPVVAAAAPVAPAVPVTPGGDDDDKEGVPAAVESAAEGAATAAAEPAPAEPAEVAVAPEPEAAPDPRGRAARRAAKVARAKQAAAKAAPAAEEEPLFAEKKAPAAKAAPAESGGSDIDDLLAAAPAKAAPAEKAAPADTGNSDVDDLLGAPAKKPAAKRSIDDLLDVAVTESAQKKGAAKATPAPAPVEASGGLAEAPGREDVLKAIKGVTPAVRACAQGQSGVAKVAITVSSSGQVTGAQASGVDDPIKSCIEDAVRNADFPQFSKPTFRVDYPFKF